MAQARVKMLNTVGVLKRSASGLWQAHAAVTWSRAGSKTRGRDLWGLQEDPDLIMGMESVLLGVVPMSCSETVTWPQEGPGMGFFILSPS